MNKFNYTLWLIDPKGRWLYEWANIFRSAEEARGYKKHLEEGCRAGYRWQVVENEIKPTPSGRIAGKPGGGV